MNKNIINSQIDDFWTDCINNPTTNNINLNKTLNISNYKNNNIKNHFRLYKNKLKNPKKVENIISANLNDTTNIREALKKEELIPLRRKQKQQELNQLFLNKYIMGKAKKELLKNNNKKQRELTEKLEVEECTFKPEISKNKRLEKKINQLYNGYNIYQRNVKLRKQHNEKMALLLKESNKFNNDLFISECLFHPYIINKNIDKILYDENNIWKNQADNDSTKLFLLRYMKAREEEFDKREQSASLANIKLREPKRMIRALSQKDSLIMKKNLHNSLYSFKNLFTDEDDNEENGKKEEENENDEKNKDNKQIKFNNKTNNNSRENEQKTDSFQWTFAKKNEN